MKAPVCPVATYGCKSWTLRKNEETRFDCLEMKKLRKIYRISWTPNKWVLNKAGVKAKLSNIVEVRKLAYCGHTMRKQGSCLEKEIMQGTMPGASGKEDHAWTGWTKSRLPVEESIRMTEDRDKWRKYVHGVANPRIEDG